MKTWTKGIVAGLLAGVVILGSLPALADPYGSNIDRREMNQERRDLSGRAIRADYSRGISPPGKSAGADSRHRGPDAGRRPPGSL